MQRRSKTVAALSVWAVLVLGACSTGGDDDGGGSASEPDPNAAVSTDGDGGYRLRSPVTQGEIEISAEDAQAGLEAMEERFANPDPGSEKLQCWLMVRDDGTIAQAMRCGPSIDPDGQVSWRTFPFADAESNDPDQGRELVYEPRLIGEVEPPANTVDFVRPDGQVAPDGAASDDGGVDTRVDEPEAPADCDATGTVTDSVNGDFDLADADFLEVEALVADGLAASDGRTQFRHDLDVYAWSDAADRGIIVQLSATGPPGEAELSSLSVAFEVASRTAVEAHQNPGDAGSGRLAVDELPGDLVDSWDVASGGDVEVEFTTEAAFSLDPDITISTDLEISCSS